MSDTSGQTSGHGHAAVQKSVQKSGPLTIVDRLEKAEFDMACLIEPTSARELIEIHHQLVKIRNEIDRNPFYGMYKPRLVALAVALRGHFRTT